MAEDGQQVEGSLYWYAPNRGAPIAFALLFLISGAVHTWQSFHYHSWRITWIYAWSSLLFIAGYILRSIGSYNFDNLPILIASTVLLYAAPPIYELGNYLVLGRCLHYIPHHSPIHPDRTLTLFLALSAVVEALTANGAARNFTTDDDSSRDVGKALLKTALVMQLGIMAVQILLAVKYQRSCTRSGILRNNTGSADITNVLVTLYASCVLITIRTIFRTVEYFAVADLHPTANTTISDIPPLIRYEWFFWVFESSVMLLNSVLLNFRHPGKYLPQNKKAYLTESGEEKDGMEFGDNRPVWRKVVDPLDLYGLVLGRDERWWERDRVDGGDGAGVEEREAGKQCGKGEGK